MNPIDHFLETNYINPIILKYTRFAPVRREGQLSCGGKCGGYFDLDEMQAIYYSNGKRVLRCESCMRRYAPRRGTKSGLCY